MDQQNRVGSKFGGGGVASGDAQALDRRERLRKLALETIDLAKDPYILRNHLGGLECRLCLTLHTNEGSYLAHTQGKKHQTNLARRAAKDNYDPTGFAAQQALQLQAQKTQVATKSFIKIGSPGYQVTKVRDPITGQLGMLFQVHYPQIADGVKPRQRFMSSFEQHVEVPDRAWQYLIIAAEPYQSVSFKIQAREIDSAEGMAWEHWDVDSKTLSFQFLFDQDQDQDQEEEEDESDEPTIFQPFHSFHLIHLRPTRRGYDANGFDDGSWRGNAADYGSPAPRTTAKVKPVDPPRPIATPPRVLKTNQSVKDGAGDSSDGEDSGAQDDGSSGEQDTQGTDDGGGGDGSSFDDSGNQDDSTGTKDTSQESSKHTDCDVLTALFSALAGESWLNKTGWETAKVNTTGIACCEFYGVSCNAAGRVSALDLAGNGLRGPLDDEVFELAYLQRLNLSSNGLTGPLPDKFSFTPSLSSLSLANNLLSGALPPSLSNSSSLVLVHLSNNSLTGPLAFPYAANLSSLSVARNQFDGPLDLSHNGGLQKVDVGYNSFGGLVPDLGGFPGLLSFQGARNNFTGGVRGLLNATNLVKM
ncbi:hypothetical protein RQP46_009623 [Phenoliferia psychrophenolica]